MFQHTTRFLVFVTCWPDIPLRLSCPNLVLHFLLKNKKKIKQCDLSKWWRTRLDKKGAWGGLGWGAKGQGKGAFETGAYCTWMWWYACEVTMRSWPDHKLKIAMNVKEEQNLTAKRQARNNNNEKVISLGPSLSSVLCPIPSWSTEKKRRGGLNNQATTAQHKKKKIKGKNTK